MKANKGAQFSALVVLTLVTMMFANFSFLPQAQGADLKSSEIPSAQSSTHFLAPDSTATTVLRDTGFGLGAGMVTGVLFSLMSGGNFSQPTNMIRSDAFGTGLVTGLLGGIITGIWQAKKKESRHLSTAEVITSGITSGGTSSGPAVSSSW